MTSEGDGGQNSTKDAIMKVIQSRKNQLYKQIESVQQVNDEAEKVSLLSMSRTQFKLKYPNPLEETDGQQNPARTSSP